MKDNSLWIWRDGRISLRGGTEIRVPEPEPPHHTRPGKDALLSTAGCLPRQIPCSGGAGRFIITSESPRWNHASTTVKTFLQDIRAGCISGVKLPDARTSRQGASSVFSKRPQKKKEK